MTKFCEFGDGSSALLTYSSTDTYWDEKSYKKPFKTITVNVDTYNKIFSYWKAGRLEHVLVRLNDENVNTGDYFSARVGAIYDISDDAPNYTSKRLMVVFKVKKPDN